MNRLFSFLLTLLVMVGGAAAQPPERPPVIGPADEGPRRSVWQILTPDQREQLWRSLSPEQRTDLWRALEPQERRELRDLRARPVPPDPSASVVGPQRRPFEYSNGPRTMMTPEERQEMREQIREAHRLRRERLEAERKRPPE